MTRKCPSIFFGQLTQLVECHPYKVKVTGSSPVLPTKILGAFSSQQKSEMTHLKMKPLQWKMETQIRPIYLVASGTGLRGIFWQKQSIPLAKSLTGSSLQMKILGQAVCELEEYFSGQRKNFDLPLELTGTPFQKKVWAQLCKIPYGKTCAYKDIASRIKNAKAMRAVGTANGKNPFCIVIPCHRVIAADGSLGGYTGGLALKGQLLALEQGSARE